MTYISSIQRLGEELGYQKGLLSAIKLGLKLKFGAEGLQLYPAVAQISEVDRLQSIYDGLNADASLIELRRLCTAPQDN